MIHDAVPGAWLVVLDETGYLGHVQCPEGFTAAVVAFLTAARENTA